MRVLQAFWDGGGNTAPQLAIARELIARGHEVTFLGNACQRERVEATGAKFAAYVHAPDNDSRVPDKDLIRDWEARTPVGAFARIRDRLMYGPAELFARDVIEQLERSPAEVVAWDYLLIGAGLGAERAGTGSAALVHTIFPIPTEGVPPFGQGFLPARGPFGRARDAVFRRLLVTAFRPGLRPLNEARAELGLERHESPFDQVLGADRVLVLTSPSFDLAAGAGVGANVVHTGPAFDPVASDAGWDSPWPADDDRPLVIASFSTTYMDQTPLAIRVVEALGGLPVRALITAGPAIDASLLPGAENVEVRSYVPHAAVMPAASLAITHAGMGTVHAALAAGVPLLCIPQGRDQGDVAARVVDLGVGLRAGRNAGASKLRALAGQALADPALAEGAQRLARAFAAEDGAARAADEIEALAADEADTLAR